SSPNQERIKFEKSRLMIDVQASMDHFNKKVKYRDLAEQVGVMIVIPAMAYSAYAIPHVVTKLASVLTIGWAIYIAVRLRSAKKHKPGAFAESYMDYLYKTRA